MIFLIQLLLWIPLTYGESQCDIFPDSIVCNGLYEYDFRYYLYRNEEYTSMNYYYSETIISNYKIYILNSNYSKIEKIINPPMEDVTLEVTTLVITNSSVEVIQEDAFEELTALKKLDLSWNNIDSVSFIIPPYLVDIDLSHNKIKTIDFSLLKIPMIMNFNSNFISTLVSADDAKMYDFADFSYNNIMEFDEDNLNCFFNSLNISFNGLTSISLKAYQINDFYKSYSKSDRVQLSGNKLRSIETRNSYSVNSLDLTSSVFNITDDLFKNVINIREILVLRDCDLPILNNNFINLENINGDNRKPIIDFSNSTISDISANYFSHIISPLVNLSLNNLELIRNGVFEDANINVLDISSCKLKYIDRSAFRGLRSIEIYLNQNELETTNNICNQLETHKLDLSFNSIATIGSNSFLNCRELRTLNLSNSIIEKIETGGFAGLSSLNVLDLTYNKLSTLESNFLKNSPLNTLLLHGNKINTISSQTFNTLYYLKVLNLSGCEIMNIMEYAFDNIRNVEVIDLRNNNITVLESNTFVHVSTNKITLEGNYIKHIKRNAFNNIHNMPLLNLSGIGITDLDERAFTSLSNIDVIDLSNNNLTDMKGYTFFDLPVYTIDLHGNKLTTIRENTFKNLTRIRILDLSKIGINYVEQKSFTNLPNIETIDLSNNNLTVIEKYTFSDLPVRTIKLHGNKIGTIRYNAFNNLNHLQALDLSGLSIHSLEEYSFFDLPNLEVLDLSNNNLRILKSHAFFNLPVKILKLEDNHIEVIKSLAFSRLSNIGALNLSYCGITDLEPMAFSYLPTVDYIDLRSNYIATIPDDLFYKMTKLNSIFLDGNNLTSIRPFDDSLRLKHLTITFTGILEFNGISNQYIRTISFKKSEIQALRNNCFLGLYNLKELHFDNNSNVHLLENDALNGLFKLIHLDAQILFKNKTTIPSGMFKDLRRLPHLDLSNLDIHDIETNAFSGLQSLNYLFLQNNSLHNLATDAFFGLGQLLELHLEGNQIETLQNELFSAVGNLETLYLNDNKITRIGTCFHSLGKLSKLFLQNNKLNNISSDVFNTLTNLVELRLDNNRINYIASDAFSNLDTLLLLDLSNNYINYEDIYIEGTEVIY